MNEFIEDDIKTIIEYKINDEGKKVKVLKFFILKICIVRNSIIYYFGWLIVGFLALSVDISRTNVQGVNTKLCLPLPRSMNRYWFCG